MNNKYITLEQNNLKDIFATDKFEEDIFNQDFKNIITDISKIQDQNKVTIDSLINSRKNTILLFSSIPFFLLTFMLFSVNYQIKTVIDVIWTMIISFGGSIFGVALVDGLLPNLPFKKVKLIINQETLIKEKFIKKLETKEFQAEILLYLTRLENNNNLDIENKNSIQALKNNLIIFFYDKQYKKAQDCLFSYGKFFLHLNSCIEGVLSNEDKITSYLKDLENETNIKINTNSNIDNEEIIDTGIVADYRKHV